MALPLVALWGVENEQVVRDIAAACRGDYSYLHRTLNSLDGMDFPRVTLCGPMQTAFGRVVCVVVEKRRDGVVNPVHVVESDSYGALPVRVAIKN